MHPNAELIEKFYSCFKELDGNGMAQCYHEKIQFSDTVFPAYDDVKSIRHFKTVWQQCLTRFYLAKLLRQPRSGMTHFDLKTYRVIVPTQYKSVYKEPILEDFVVAAYVAIRLNAAMKPGRSSKDAAYFAIALYHGMRTMVVAAQASVQDDIHWSPVEAELISKGHNDEVAYVHEVVR